MHCLNGLKIVHLMVSLKLQLAAVHSGINWKLEHFPILFVRPVHVQQNRLESNAYLINECAK